MNKLNLIHRNLVSDSHRIFQFRIIILCLILFPYMTGFANQIDAGSRVEIGIINFLYLHDKGYDSQSNSKHEIEMATLFPALEKEIRQSGISNYSIKFEKVITGNLEYFGSGAMNSELNKPNGNSHDLSVWGLVQPITWPSHYDLDLIIFIDSNLLLRSNIKIRNNKIALWDGYKCNLPKDAFSIIPGTFANVLSHQKENKLDDDVLIQISEHLKLLPNSLMENIMNTVRNWSSQTRKSQNENFGRVDFVYESGIDNKVSIDQLTYDMLQRFLTTNKSYNWYLDQGGVLMPEISIVLGSPDREINTSDFEMPYSKLKVPAQVQIGIVPFKNKSDNSEQSWVGFGLEYLLSNKFSHIPSYKLADRNVVLKFMNSDSASVIIDGNEWSLDYTIGGFYDADDRKIEVDLTYIKPYSGTQLASDHYLADYDKFFEIVDDVAKKFLRVTGIVLSETEEKLFDREVTSSMKAFESFCMGYIENARPERDEERVIKYFLEAIKDDPEFWGAYYNLGTTFYNQEEYDQALSQFNYIIDQYPSFEMAYLGRGLTYFQKKDFYNAKADFENYSLYKPIDFRAYYYLGRILIQQKKYADALENLNKAIELNPNYGKNYFELGNIYYAMNRFRPAIMHYQQAIKLDPSHLDTHLRLGESYYRMHNFSGAINEFKTVLAVKPDDANANFMMGVTVYKQALLDQYIDDFLEMYGLLNVDEIEMNLGKHQAEQIRIYDEMTRRFYLAQDSRANFYEATFNLALTYQERGIADSALIFYNKTLKLNPNLTKARVVLAKFYEKQDEMDLALEEYKTVVRNDPGYFVGYSKLGPLYNDLDIVAVVTEELETEVKADPHNIDSSLSLAGIYHAQGFDGKAATLYRRVLSLHPEQKKAKVMLARINGNE